MATQMRIEDRFPCSAKTLYDLLSDQAFDDELMRAIVVGKKTLEYKETDGGSRLKVTLSPQTKLPGFMKKIMGGRNEYDEIRVWTEATLSNTWKIEPNFPGKIDIGGTLTITPDGDSACVRVVEGTFKVGIPLIGKKIEKFIIEQTKESFAQNTQYCVRYLREHP